MRIPSNDTLSSSFKVVYLSPLLLISFSTTLFYILYYYFLVLFVILLYQDGHNLFDAADSFCGDTWQIRETMDDLCCNGAIKECIVVGMYLCLQLYFIIITTTNIILII